jgi:hypothetical protein
MHNPDNSSDAGAPTHGQTSDDSQLRSFALTGLLVVYDVEDARRWIQSDTTVDLVDKR